MTEDWERSTLGNVADWLSGGTPRKSESQYWDGDIPWISGASLKSDRLWDSERRVTDKAVGNGTRLAPFNSTLILVRGMSLIDQIRIGRTLRPMAFNQDVKALVPKREVVDPEFLTYLLLARVDELLGMVHRAGHGTGVLDTDQLQGLEIALPPLDAQRRIVSVLGRVDDLVHTNQRLIRASREMAAILYTGLDSSPKTFGEVAELRRIGVQPSDMQAGEPFLGLEHFAVGGAGVVAVGDAGDIGSAGSRFERGDVLFGKLRPYFRKVDRLGFPGVCTNEAWVLRPRDRFTSAFLYSVVQSPDFIHWCMSGAGGTRMPRADWRHACSYVVNAPIWNPETRAVNEAAETLWKAVWSLREEQVLIQRTRNELLPLLMSGQVLPGEVV